MRLIGSFRPHHDDGTHGVEVEVTGTDLDEAMDALDQAAPVGHVLTGVRVLREPS